MIAHLVFHRNGSVWASDERGFQIAEEQEPAWWIVIQDKLARGVIDENTVVSRDHYSDMTVGEIVRWRLAADRIFPTGKGEEVKIMSDEIKIEIGCKLTGNALPTELNSASGPFQKAFSRWMRGEIKTDEFVTAAAANGVALTSATLVNAGQRIALPFEVTAHTHHT
jgi:hypothetical protein